MVVIASDADNDNPADSRDRRLATRFSLSGGQLFSGNEPVSTGPDVSYQLLSSSATVGPTSTMFSFAATSNELV